MKLKRLFLSMTLAITLCAAVSPVRAIANEPYDTDEYTEVLSDNIKVDSRLRELFFGNEKQTEQIKLIPGGNVFGIKMKQKYVTVIDSEGIPTLSAGDVIISINGKEVHTINEVRGIVENSGGSSVTIRAMHRGEQISIETRPTLIDGKYRLGISLRDSASGIGTVTFYDPKTGAFGGLGHGICDSDTGDVIPMESGEVCGVILGGVHKGECGKPGELSGILKDDTVGRIDSNNECGVFGNLTALPSLSSKTAIPIGTKAEVQEGEATIISTLKNGKSAEYKIEIYDIDKTSEGSKSFRIRTNDPALIAISGGIVRGMSGSPIIQNGKLIGAVTHVMVANPTEGYGIFIENMLNFANIPMAKAS